MKRRDICAATAILASLGRGRTLAADARPLRLGVLASADDNREIREGSVFLGELARQGYARGRNLTIELRSSERLGMDGAASALVAAKVDVIYAIDGSAAALAAKRATASIPVVFRSANPVAYGLVASLPRPGGNLTGVSIQGPALTAKEMEAMAAALGALRSMAYLHPPDSPSFPWHANYVAAAGSAATALGVRIEFHEVPGVAAYEPLIQDLVRRRVDAAGMMPSTPAFTLADPEYERVGALFVRHRLPAVGPPSLGFLLRYEIAEDLVSRRMAYFVGRIAGGARPADLPVEELSSLRLILNAKVARASGSRCRDRSCFAPTR